MERGRDDMLLFGCYMSEMGRAGSVNLRLLFVTSIYT